MRDGEKQWSSALLRAHGVQGNGEEDARGHRVGGGECGRAVECVHEQRDDGVYGQVVQEGCGQDGGDIGRRVAKL